MKVTQVLYSAMAIILYGAAQASEYFGGYDVNQPAIEQSARARAYQQAYDANVKTRLVGFYNRLKGALGFPAQQRPGVSEYEEA